MRVWLTSAKPPTATWATRASTRGSRGKKLFFVLIWENGQSDVSDARAPVVAHVKARHLCSKRRCWLMWQACKNAKKVTLLPVMCTREVGPHVLVWACL